MTFPPHKSSRLSRLRSFCGGSFVLVLLGFVGLAATARAQVPIITSGDFNAFVNQPIFSYQITVQPGPPAPTSYSVSLATPLPAGLSLDSSTGIISGTPTAIGTFPLLLSATNANGTGSKTVTFRIFELKVPTITSGNGGGTLNEPFAYQIIATESPTSYGASGLPAGLTLNATTGLISGTPTQFGVFSVNISASNPSGTGNATVTFNIRPLIPPVIVDADTTGIQGQPFFYAITVAADSEPITSYAADGLALIGGLTLNTVNGTISGIPQNAGTFAVVISATNAWGTTSQQITITITGASVRLEGAVPQGETYKLLDRVPWSATVTATGGTTVQPFTWVAYVTGQDVYRNEVYIELGRGVVPILAADNSFVISPGDWIIPNDGTLYNIDAGYSFVVALYKQDPPPAPPVPNTLAQLRAPFLSLVGRVKIDVIANIAVPMPGVGVGAIYPGPDQKQFFRGGDIVQFQTSWMNRRTGERTVNGRVQSRPLRARDRYRVSLHLTSNPAFNIAALPAGEAATGPADTLDEDELPEATDEVEDDYQLLDIAFAADLGPGGLPDGFSEIRRVEVTGTPPPLEPYGIAGVTDTTRNYAPQPYDGFLDIGEGVSVVSEELMPDNFVGRYFVASRVGMTSPELDAGQGNNVFVSNAAPKIELVDRDAPTLQPVSAITTDEGVFVEGSYNTSDFSSVSENGDLIAFESAANNLLIPPQKAEVFTGANGLAADMSLPENYPALFGGLTVTYAEIVPYLTTGRQIFLKYRQTGEMVLVSRDASGDQANADALNPWISANGRYVAFQSRATNLNDQRDKNTGGRSAIFVYDTLNLETALVSVNADGLPANGDCFNPRLSESGRFVVFESKATNLDLSRPVASTAPQQIYLHDRDVDGDGPLEFDADGNTATYLVSAAEVGERPVPFNGYSARPALNLDDRFAKFTGSIEGTTLTVTAVQKGKITVGMTLMGDGITTGTKITALGTGVGGLGTYIVDTPQSVPSTTIEELRPMFVAFTSYATNAPDDNGGYAMVYRASIDVRNPEPAKRGAVLDQLVAVSLNPAGELPDAYGYDLMGAFIRPDCDDPSINGDGSVVAFTSAATNFVPNEQPGDPPAAEANYEPTYPNDSPFNPSLPPTSDVVPGGDYNRVPDVFVRDFNLAAPLSLVRVSVSNDRVATGWISFATPTSVPGNVPDSRPLPDDAISISDGGTTAPPDPSDPTPPTPTPPQKFRFVFDPTGAPLPAPIDSDYIDVPVPIGANVQESRDNLINAIQAAFGGKILAAPTTPPNIVNPAVDGVPDPGIGYNAALYLKNLYPGAAGNTVIEVQLAPRAPTQPAIIAASGMSGGGRQAEDDALAPGDPLVQPIQGVPFGSGQPSIDRTGTRIAFRTIATNLDVYQETDENIVPALPPYPGFPQQQPFYPAQERTLITGELIRPLIFPTANVYLHDRNAKGLTDEAGKPLLDREVNTRTERVSVSNFGYPTEIFEQQPTGVNANTSAANHSPAISANGRFISFSSDSTGEGGLVFDRNNLDYPEGLRNVRNVFVQDRQLVGESAPPPDTLPIITLTSPTDGTPEDGISVPSGTTLSIRATAQAQAGKTITSVQFYINGAALGEPLLTTPYAAEFLIPNAGKYVIRAVATDNRGITSSVFLVVTATPGELPEVTVTSPNEGLETPQTTLNVAWRATDKDGGVQRAEVLINGVTGIDPNGQPMIIERTVENPGANPGTNVLQFFPPSEGTYSIVVRVTDNLGNTTDSAARIIIVDNDKPNLKPTVNLLQGPIAESLYTIGSRLFFNATVETKNGATIAPDGVRFLINGVPIPATNSFVPPRPGIFTTIFKPENSFRVQAEATDSATNVGYSVLTPIGLYFPTKSPPTVEMLEPNPGDTNVVEGGFVTLRAEAIFPADPAAGAGALNRVEFYANGAFVGVGTNAAPDPADPAAVDPNIFTFNWRLPKAADALTNSYIVQARAVTLDQIFEEPAPPPIGANENIFQKEEIYTSVISDNFQTYSPGTAVKPVISIKSPLPETKVPVGQPITLQSTASVLGGTIARVEYYANGELVPVNPDAAPPTAGNSYSVTFTPESKGEIILIAVAYSNKGIAGQSKEVKIVVPAEGEPDIEITSPAEDTIFTPGATFAASAKVTINEDTKAPIRNVRFFLNEVEIIATDPATGEALPPDDTAPYSAQVTLQGVGNYFLKAIATDIYGNTKAASIRVICDVPPQNLASPVVYMTHPTPAGQTADGNVDNVNDFSTPSQFFFNAIASLPDTSARFTGSISGTTLTVTAVERGTLAKDMQVTGEGIAPGTFITGLLAGKGGTGTYTVSVSQSATSRKLVAKKVDVAVEDVQFFSNGVAINEDVEQYDGKYSTYWRPTGNGDYNITAQVSATYTELMSGKQTKITSVSEPLFFQIGNVARFVPSIKLRPVGTGTATVNSRVLIQTETNQGPEPIDRIDFYANGVLIGSAAPRDADNTPVTTTFEWVPRASGAFKINARAVQVVEGGADFGADNSIMSNTESLSVAETAGSTPLVNLLQQPIAETLYVYGSQLFLNATVAPRGTATIPADGVKFYYNSEVLDAPKSGVLFGSQNIYSTKVNVEDSVPEITLFATARDSNNATSSSSVATLQADRPLFPLPEAEMLPLFGPGPFSAGEDIVLRARAEFPPTANTEARVEFYANGAYLGAGVEDEQNPGIYVLTWETPETSGDYVIEARAVALNFTRNIEDNNSLRFFGSSISLNSVTAPVQAVPSVLVPGSNGAFVVDIYNELLYRDPTYIEWFEATDALDAGVIDRASFVMALMGFDPVRKVFNRQVEFGRTVMTACLPFYRLGLTPNEGQILSFITFLEADDRPLPIFGSDDGGGGGGGETGGSDYSGIPDAPWGATYGMGAAMQNVVLRSAQFRLKYPAVTGLANIAFNNWLRDVMFRGVSGGDETLIIEMMNTIFPQNIRQGAAMAFRSELAWVALESDYVVAPEQQIQLQAATTILNFQLNGVWDAAYGKKNPYSKNTVESLLSSVGLSTSGASPAFRGPPRSYQGVFGSGPTVASASTKSVAATMAPRVSGEVRVSTSATGTYSATLTMANGTVHRFKGVLKGDGSIQDQWAPGLSVNLTPVEDGVAKYLGGTVSFGSNPATAVAGRLIYSKDAPFGSPGNYTLSLRIDPAPAANARLQGSGFATVKISSAGVARFSGRLADNTPFTGSFPVWGATGEPGEQALLVHRALAKGAGAIGGRISRRDGGVGSGEMIWNVAPTAVGSGGEVSLEATLSLYRGISNGSVLPFGWPYNGAPFSLDWSAGAESGAVGFTTPGTLFGSDPGLRLLLKVNTSSGLVGGTFTDSESGAKYKIGGILDQATKTIDGFFLTPDSSGRLEINR